MYNAVSYKSVFNIRYQMSSTIFYAFHISYCLQELHYKKINGNVINFNEKFVLLSRLVGSLIRYPFHHSFICVKYILCTSCSSSQCKCIARESIYWIVMFHLLFDFEGCLSASNTLCPMATVC